MEWAKSILEQTGFRPAALPFAFILGVSFGKSMVKARKTEAAIRVVCGVLLIIAGFYFLATI
jgi:hypothetical protein